MHGAENCWMADVPIDECGRKRARQRIVREHQACAQLVGQRSGEVGKAGAPLGRNRPCT